MITRCSTANQLVFEGDGVRVVAVESPLLFEGEVVAIVTQLPLLLMVIGGVLPAGAEALGALGAAGPRVFLLVNFSCVTESFSFA